jgi:hypothetical protein
MSYLSQPTSVDDYGVVKIGNFIKVIDGVISLQQDVSPTADVVFDSINVTTSIDAVGNITSLGKVSGANILDNGNRVITSITPSATTGISITGLTTSGPAASFTINNTGVTSAVAGAGISVNSATGAVTFSNTGVLSLTAGSGISLTAGTGNITISSFGADLINVIGVTTNYTATLTDEYIGVSSANAVTITLPTGVDGRVYTIKDEFGQGSGKITIQPPTGVLIDKKTNYIISVPNQSVSVVYRAGGWWIM